MDRKKRVSLWWIIMSDYVAQLTVLFPLVMWGIYVAVSVFGLPALKLGQRPLNAGDESRLLNMAMIVTAICLPVLIWRFRRFASLFSAGSEVAGRVIKVWFYRGRGGWNSSIPMVSNCSGAAKL